MTYPFVQSFHDAGLRKGPIRGFLVHFAEGGGTVGYLSRENPNGVSVHYVIEYSGRTVQMLLESHMHTSIRIGSGGLSLRQDTGSDGFGYAVAKAVLGDWATVATTLGPNHSTVAVEIEGFAVNGPNPAQTTALIQLAADVRARNSATIRGNTGHRDHNVKVCPGQLIPWASLGGHGLYAASVPTPPEAPMAVISNATAVSGTVTTRAGASVYNLRTNGWGPYGANETYPVQLRAQINSAPCYLGLVGDDLVAFLDTSVDFLPAVPIGGGAGMLDEAAIRKDQLARDRKVLADHLLPDS